MSQTVEAQTALRLLRGGEGRRALCAHASTEHSCAFEPLTAVAASGAASPPFGLAAREKRTPAIHERIRSAPAAASCTPSAGDASRETSSGTAPAAVIMPTPTAARAPRSLAEFRPAGAHHSKRGSPAPPQLPPARPQPATRAARSDAALPPRPRSRSGPPLRAPHTDNRIRLCTRRHRASRGTLRAHQSPQGSLAPTQQPPVRRRPAMQEARSEAARLPPQ